jgi:hypothetical protein
LGIAFLILAFFLGVTQGTILFGYAIDSTISILISLTFTLGMLLLVTGAILQFVAYLQTPKRPGSSSSLLLLTALTAIVYFLLRLFLYFAMAPLYQFLYNLGLDYSIVSVVGGFFGTIGALLLAAIYLFKALSFTSKPKPTPTGVKPPA